MKKLKNNQILSMLGIVTLFLVIIGLVDLMNIDKYYGKVKLSKVSVSNISSKYNANVIDVVPNDNVQSRGYDEITYTVSYNLSANTDASNRSVLLKATLDDNENYAIFKDITKDNVTSTLSNGGKQIDVVIDNVNAELDNKISLKIIVQGAPNGHNIKPSIEIKESTEDNYTSISTSKIVVSTNSLSGTVTDENGTFVSNIELALLKNGVVIKKVYTNEEGKYVFSDIDEGSYEILIDEEIYEKIKENTTSVNGDNILDIKVKSIEPYKIETKKLITKLVVDELGTKQEFTYGEVPKVVQSLKNYYGFTGQIEYVVKVKNTGKKSGIVTVVKDEIPNGLTFDKNKNYGWENVDGVLYNRNLEGITLKSGEERTEKLVLDITKTTEAKTYLNKIVVKGELYERVVFILNGKKYKEFDVVEGEKINNVEILSDSFSGWYTDEKLTNKYNFKNEVNKDLILYGVTDVVKHKVTFIDDNPETKSKDLYDEQEVVDGKSPIKPSDPEHNGYEFKCWVKQNNVCFDFDEDKITDEIELTSTYETIKYNIIYKGLTNDEKASLNNPTEYTIESDDITLVNPQNRLDNEGDLSEIFVGWEETGIEGITNNVTIVKGSKGNREYTAVFETVSPDSYPITYNLNGGNLEEGKTNPTSYTKKTNDFTLNNPSKIGYDFVGWTGSNGDEPNSNLTITKGTTGNLEFTANYTPTTYHLTYNYDGGSLLPGRTNPETYTIETEDFTLNNPVKNGYNFTGWQEDESEVLSRKVTITTGTTGDKTYTAKYEIKKYTVIYYDEGLQYSTEIVEYGKFATKPVDPTKANSIFYYWTLSDGTKFDFNTEINDSNTTDGVLNLYSKYGDIVPPTITHLPTEWTNDNVTVTITSEYEDYSYKYKIGETGEYQNYTEPFEVEENTNVIAKSIKNGEESIVTVHEITNIDKEKPLVLSLIQSNITNTSFDINTSSIDYESGLKQIDIYIDNVFETTFSYSDNVNEEKEVNYSFTGLEEETTYAIKVVATDIAGNVSDSFEKNFKTSQVVVARVIGRDGILFEDESLYEDYRTLDSAIKACPDNQCTIQMVLDTVESVEVLEGQDITLDLNEKTVVGDKDTHTIKNSGSFIVVDRSDETGSIVNRNGVAIKNETIGTLTIGENEEELVVSKTKPYIVGNTIGVFNSYIDEDNNGTFNFYDGLIVGIQAIDGEVNDKPYLYNASVKMRTRQEATLEKLANAEARNMRTGIYYSQLSKAFNESNNGTSETSSVETNLLAGFEKLPDSVYGFIYDEENNTLTPETGPSSTTSEASTIIDLTNYEEDQLLTFDDVEVEYQTNWGTSKASVYINGVTRLEDNKSIYSLSHSSETGSDYGNSKYILEKGYMYNVKIYYNSSYNTTENLPYFTNMSISDYTTEETNFGDELELNTSIKNYGFDYDENTKQYKSNNQYEKNSVAFSYIEVDLTHSGDTDKEIIISASLDTLYDYNVGSVFVKENNNIEEYYNSSAFVYLYGCSETNHYNGPRTYSKILTAGKKYYVQFYYFKNSSDTNTREKYQSVGSSDQFIINSLNIVDAPHIYKEINSNDTVITPGDNGFTFSGNFLKNNNSSDIVSHSYIEVDLTGDNNQYYFKSTVRGGSNSYVVISDSPDDYDESNAINNKIMYFSGASIYGNMMPNKKNYIHFVSTTNGIQFYDMKIIKGTSIDMKKLKYNSAGHKVFQYYDGYLIGDGYTNPVESNKTYDSYVEVDLTDYEEDQILTINSYMNGYNPVYYYISDNRGDVSYNSIANVREKSLFYWNSNTDKYYYVNGSSVYYNYYDYKFYLKKGNKYYIHIAENTSYSTRSPVKYLGMTLTPIENTIISTGKMRYFKSTNQASDQYLNDETEDANFRFIGKNPDNYVKFNNELWRIIGIFNTKDSSGNTNKRIKLVRNDSLGSDIVYDSTPYVSGGPPINGGLGINEWSESLLMKLLNPGYDSNSIETFTKGENNSYISNGDEVVNNSLYWNKQSGKCVSGNYNVTKECDFTSTGLNENAKSLIDTVVWNTGSLPASTDTTPINLYKSERGNDTAKSNSYTTTAIDDELPRNTTWTGKVALPYISDYIMAAGDLIVDGEIAVSRDTCMTSGASKYGACTSNNSWMNTSSPLSLLSPVNGYLHFTSYGATTYVNMPASYGYMLKPSVYLNPKVRIKSGDGSENSPYVFELGENINETKNYGLTAKDDVENTNEILDNENDLNFNFVKKKDLYGFTYNVEDNSYNNENYNIPKSEASSYIVLDLTSELDDKNLNVELEITGNTDTYINLMQDNYELLDYSNYTSSDFAKSRLWYGSNGNYNFNTIIKSGHIYYLQFYTKNINSNNDDAKVKIKFNTVNIENTTSLYSKYSTQTILNEKPDTIQMLRDITLNESLTNVSTRDVIIDLNGKKLTNISNDYVMKNYGSMKVIDSKYIASVGNTQSDSSTSEIQGTIESNVTSVIYNGLGAYLNMSEGIVNLNKAGNYSAIDNYGQIQLSKDVYVNAKNTNNIGITNNTTGDILTGAATIEGKLYSISNLSNIDKEIDGYKMTGAPFNQNNSRREITLNNIEISNFGTPQESSDAILFNSRSSFNMTINNSKIIDTALKSSGYVLNPHYYGSLNINNTSIETYRNSKTAIRNGRIRSGSTLDDRINYTSSTSVNLNNFTTNGTVYFNSEDEGSIIDSEINELIIYRGTILADNLKTKTSIENYGELTLNNYNTTNTIYNYFVRYINDKYIRDNSGKLFVNDSSFTIISNMASADIKDSICTGYVRNGEIEATLNLTNVKFPNAYIENYGAVVADNIEMTREENNTGLYNKRAITNYSLIDSSDNKIYGNVILKNSTITGYNIGVDDGNLTLGEKNSEEKNKNIITTLSKGINVRSLNYYDGIINSKLDSSIISTINDVPDNYDVQITENAELGTEIATLVLKEEKDYIASIGEKKYKTLQSAFDDINSETATEIKIIKDFSTVVSSELSNERNVKIDFNGHRIKYYGPDGLVVNNGNLELNDTSEDIKQSLSFSKFIDNKETMNFYNINIKYGKDYDYLILNDGMLNINSGILSGSGIGDYNEEYLVYNNSILNCYDGTFEKSDTVFKNYNSSTLNILGGEFRNNETIVNNFLGATALVSSASIDNTNYRIFNNYGTLTVKDIVSNVGAIGFSYKTNDVLSDTILEDNNFSDLKDTYSSSGNITINSGIYNWDFQSNELDKYAIKSSKGKLTINDAKITSSSSGIYMYSSSSLEINNIDLSTESYGVNLETTGTTIIKGGSIVSSSSVALNNQKNSTGNIVIGEKGDLNEDGTLKISISNPLLEGSTYGLLNANPDADIRFYDGIIVGGTKAFDAIITEIEDDTSIVLSTKDGKEAKYLEKAMFIENKTKVEQTSDIETYRYNNVQQAIDESENGDELVVLREITGLSTTDTYIIPTDKEITLDINGFRFIQNNSLLFENNGTLTIKNSSHIQDVSNEGEFSYSYNGYIYNSGTGNIITNNGTLNLENVKIEDSTSKNIIENTGTLNLNKVYIEDLSSGFSIVNSGTVEMNKTYVYTYSGKIINNMNNFIINNSKLKSTYMYTIITNSSYLEINNTEIYQSHNSDADDYMINNSNTLKIKGSKITRAYPTEHTYDELDFVMIYTTGELLDIDDSILKSYSQNSIMINRIDGVINVDNTSIESKYGININASTASNESINLTNVEFIENKYSIIESINETYDRTSLANLSTTVNLSGSTTQEIKIYDRINLNVTNNSTISKITDFGSRHSITDSTITGNLTASDTCTLNFTNSILEGSTNCTTANIVSGEIKGNLNSIDITLGTKGDKDENNDVIVSTTNPKVKNITSSYAEIYFYDGIIAGSYSVFPKEVEEGYVVEHISSGDILNKVYFVENSSTNKKYDDLRKAILQVKDGETLKVLENVTYVNGNLDAEISEGMTINFDLNGKTISSAYSPFTNNGTINMSNGTIKSPNILNNGVINVDAVIFSVDNAGTMNITTGTVSGTNSGTIRNNGGTLKNLRNDGTTEVQDGTLISIVNNGILTFDDKDTITINGIVNNSDVSFNSGKLTGNIENRSSGTFNFNNVNALYANILNSGIMNIEGMNGTINVEYNTKKLNLKNCNISFANSESKLTNGSLFKSGVNKYMYNSGSIDIEGGTLTKNISGELIKNLSGQVNIEDATIISRGIALYVPADPANGVVTTKRSANTSFNIKSGNIKSSASYAVYSNYGKVIVGEKKTDDNPIVSTTNPRIEGNEVAIKVENGTVDFYDGVIVASETPIYSIIGSIEDNYKIQTDSKLQEDGTTTKKESIIVEISDTERVAVVNNINYTDLQSAINATKDNLETEVTIYTNIELSDDIVIPASKIVVLNLQNTYTIIYNGHRFIENGTLTIVGDSSSNNLSANILNDLNINTLKKNIIIYEMEDGNNLSVSNTYKLYYKDDDDYKIIKMKKEEEIGTYTKGNNIEDMRTVRGRIYINNLQSGQYKLVDNKGLESIFVINDDGTLSGKIIENTNIKGKVLSSAVAELVINNQTGMTPAKYGILATLIMIIIGLLAMAIKQKNIYQ